MLPQLERAIGASIAGALGRSEGGIVSITLDEAVGGRGSNVPDGGVKVISHCFAFVKSIFLNVGCGMYLTLESVFVCDIGPSGHGCL